MSNWEHRHKVIPAVYLILRRQDGNILLIKRANTGYMDGWYSMPSGHLDGGETADMAMVREAKEEVGIDIRQSDLRMVHLLHRMAEEGDHERFDVGFEATVWQGRPKNAEPEKCDELLWADPAELPAQTIPVVRQVIEHTNRGSFYSTHNFV